MYVFAFYGLAMFVWLLFGMFYIPYSFASEGFETLVYSVPPRADLATVPISFNTAGIVLIASNFVNLTLLLLLYLYYLRQRFIGYRYFFSFEKKE